MSVFAGKFEPPRSSENDYFANSNCTFNFYPSNADSRLLVWYDYFNIVDDDLLECPSDNLTYSYGLFSSSLLYAHPFRYCGYRNFPSPFLTLRSTELFRVHFRSNDDYETGLGFEGRYRFFNRSNSLFSLPSTLACRSPFDSIIYVNETSEPSGNLSSDGYPENVVCEWSFVTTRGFQFLLELNTLQIEGSKTKDPPQGCQTTVLRIYSEGRIDELCGQQEEIYFVTTDSNWFTVQFISLNRQTKELLRGFLLYWTVIETKTTPSDAQCSHADQYFFCKKTTNHTMHNFCIHRSLLCDGHSHCQPLSSDDEHPSNCYMMIPSRSKYSLPVSPTAASFVRQHLILISIIFVLCLTMFCIALTLICLLIRMRRRQQELQSPKRQRENQQDDLLLRKKSAQTYLDDDEDDDDDDENNLDYVAVNRMEQAVTTV